MLGRRESPSEYLTQGSFVTNLIKRVSKAPQKDEIAVKRGVELQDDPLLPFRYYWITDRDDVIVKILENYFEAIRQEFEAEWNPPSADEFILRKTVGFVALLDAFDQIWPRSRGAGTANREFFAKWARTFRNNLRGRPLTVEEFGTSASSAATIANLMVARQ